MCHPLKKRSQTADPKAQRDERERQSEAVDGEQSDTLREVGSRSRECEYGTQHGADAGGPGDRERRPEWRRGPQSSPAEPVAPVTAPAQQANSALEQQDQTHERDQHAGRSSEWKAVGQQERTENGGGGTERDEDRGEASHKEHRRHDGAAAPTIQLVGRDPAQEA